MEVDAGRPLSTDELKTMHGQPVWCETLKCYGIVTVEQAGQWVGVPFILGVIDGSTATFEYNIKQRRLKCYRLVQP